MIKDHKGWVEDSGKPPPSHPEMGQADELFTVGEDSKRIPTQEMPRISQKLKVSQNFPTYLESLHCDSKAQYRKSPDINLKQRIVIRRYDVEQLYPSLETVILPASQEWLSLILRYLLKTLILTKHWLILLLLLGGKL